MLLFLAKNLKMLIVSYPKNQVVKFDTPKLGLGLNGIPYCPRTT